MKNYFNTCLVNQYLYPLHKPLGRTWVIVGPNSYYQRYGTIIF